ncbi:MAG: porin [Sulfurimonas sp.]|jgi:hypothetical protein
MKFFNNKLGFSIVAAIMLAGGLQADTASDIAELKKEIAELKEQTKTLTDETSNLQMGFGYTTVDNEASHSGLGAAASKVYYSKSPLSIGGYGEMYYSHTNKESGSNSSKVDVYRFVPYIGYKFSDNILLNVELEFEHGGVANDGGDAEGGEVIVEFIYLDFLINEWANIRVGNMLMPMGLINERHEPTLFTTVQRPNTAKQIIPTTWHESGVMVYGDVFEGLEYKFAGVTALNPTIDSDTSWLRSARGGSFTNNDPKLGFVARLDYTDINGLLAGASAYMDSNINMFDIHADYKIKGFRAYGTYAEAKRSDAFELAGALSQVKAKGGYLNLSYDLLTLSSSSDKLPLFVQFESVNSADKKTDGSSLDSIDTTTFGINYFPHDQVVLKADYAMQSQGGVDSDTFSLSMGFIF